jgi:hypothetical protein
VVAVSLAKFHGEAAALGARATPMGSRGRREAAKWLQGGQGDKDERGEMGTTAGTFLFKVARWHGVKRKRERGGGLGAGTPCSKGRKERRGADAGSLAGPCGRDGSGRRCRRRQRVLTTGAGWPTGEGDGVRA